MIFRTKLIQKGYFCSETKIVNITIEFCIFELDSVPNSSLDWQFWFFGPNLPKMGIPKNCTFACVHGDYLLYWIYLQGGQQTQRFTVSSPSNRRDNKECCDYLFTLQNIYLWHKSSKLPFHLSCWALINS